MSERERDDEPGEGADETTQADAGDRGPREEPDGPQPWAKTSSGDADNA